jgi:hypothetical protein
LFGSLLSPPPHPLPLLSTSLASKQNLFCPFLQFCWRVHKSDKDIAFLLVWGKDSYNREIPSIASMQNCIRAQIDSSLPDCFTTSLTPSHINLCHFKVTILAPLQWGHQTFSSFGFPTYPLSSCMCSPLSVWTMSNNITAFVLGLKCTYEENIWFLVVTLMHLKNFLHLTLKLCTY